MQFLSNRVCVSWHPLVIRLVPPYVRSYDSNENRESIDSLPRFTFLVHADRAVPSHLFSARRRRFEDSIESRNQPADFSSFLPSFLPSFLSLTIRGNDGSFSRQQRAPWRVFNNRNYPGNRNSGKGDAPRWFHPVSAERNWSACR